MSEEKKNICMWDMKNDMHYSDMQIYLLIGFSVYHCYLTSCDKKLVNIGLSVVYQLIVHLLITLECSKSLSLVFTSVT